jgi:4-amino-4-deoxy-L-arabinose transferase-like glycosyltransferase
VSEGPDAAPKGITLVDVAALAGILCLGSLEFGLYQRGRDFYAGDISYFELALSLVRTHSYGFDFRPETMLPPGLPAILAALAIVLGDSHTIMVRAMAVFSTLGFGMAYAVLRREQGRAFAAATTVLVMASPTFFRLATRTVFSDLPFFFTSMCTIWAAIRLDRATTSKRRTVALGAVCAVSLVLSILLRSAGVTLCLGFGAWLAVTFFVDPARRIHRLRRFVPVLLAGLLAQSLWAVWANKNETPPEWPIGGYPGAYTNQLFLKNGNQPQLGRATLGDIPRRIEQNLVDRTVGYVEIVTGKGGRLPHTWFSPLVAIPIFLVMVGVLRSIWEKGGQPYDWYFLAYEALYLVWPWDFEIRFLLPVAPLACLYAWRGWNTCLDWTLRKPRAAVGWSSLTSIVLGTLSAVYAREAGGFRPMIPVLGWVVIIAAAVTSYLLRLHPRSVPQPPIEPSHTHGKYPKGVRLAAVLTMVVVVGVDLAEEIKVGRENVLFDMSREVTYPDIVAARWIQAHTDKDAVVMARQLDVVYHYAERKVVWFPPMNDPQGLMDGISKHRVSFIIVLEQGTDNYWRPEDAECFDALSKAYPGAFRIVQESAHEKIYSVTATAQRGV